MQQKYRQVQWAELVPPARLQRGQLIHSSAAFVLDHLEQTRAEKARSAAAKQAAAAVAAASQRPAPRIRNGSSRLCKKCGTYEAASQVELEQHTERHAPAFTSFGLPIAVFRDTFCASQLPWPSAAYSGAARRRAVGGSAGACHAVQQGGVSIAALQQAHLVWQPRHVERGPQSSGQTGAVPPLLSVFASWKACTRLWLGLLQGKREVAILVFCTPLPTASVPEASAHWPQAVLDALSGVMAPIEIGEIIDPEDPVRKHAPEASSARPYNDCP